MQVFRNSPIPPHVPIMDCIKLALLADDLRRGDTLPSIPRHCDVVQGNWLESQHRVAGLLEIEADRYLQALIQDEQMRRTSLRSLCFASNLRGGRSGTAYDPPPKSPKGTAHSVIPLSPNTEENPHLEKCLHRSPCPHGLFICASLVGILKGTRDPGIHCAHLG